MTRLLVCAGLGAWLAGSVAVALLVGRVIAGANNRPAPLPEPQPDDTWLDDLPINCLSPAEIERRFARITSGEVWS